jgi:hypothetical protein
MYARYGPFSESDGIAVAVAVGCTGELVGSSGGLIRVGVGVGKGVDCGSVPGVGKGVNDGSKLGVGLNIAGAAQPAISNAMPAIEKALWNFMPFFSRNIELNDFP